MSYLDRTKHIAKFGGDIWYINKLAGSDSNDGKTPDTAFETIGKGITEMSDGDALNVKGGTYVETGLDLSNDAVEMWFEPGAILDAPSGTGLTISGDYCRISGGINITTTAGEIGLLVSGDYARIGEFAGPTILGGAIGMRITGSGVLIHNGACGLQTSKGYDIQGTQCRLYDCATVGIGASIGYHINNGVDTGTLRNCTSTGHTTSGFTIDTGSKDWTLLNCSTGGGDGRWVDTDHANTWSNFNYENIKHKVITFAGAPTTYNLFKVTGSVLVTSIYGMVETVIANTASTVHLSLYSTGGEVVLSKIVGAPDLDTLPVGSLINKVADSGTVLALNNSVTPSLIEFGSKAVGAPFVVTADADQTTYIRLNLSAALASGVMDWHCQWDPRSDNGFLEEA